LVWVLTMENSVIISLETNTNDLYAFMFGLLEVYIIQSILKSIDSITDHVIFSFDIALFIIHIVLAIYYASWI
jgi:hypothetical protein